MYRNTVDMILTDVTFVIVGYMPSNAFYLIIKANEKHILVPATAKKRNNMVNTQVSKQTRYMGGP